MAVCLAATLVPGVAHAEAPSNDHFENAIEVSVPSAHHTSLDEATFQDREPRDCYAGTRSVWYSIEPDRDMRVQISLTSDPYTWVAVFRYTAQFGIAKVACVPSLYSAGVSLEQGAIYYLRVHDDYEFPGGSEVELELREVEPPPPLTGDDFPGPPLEVGQTYQVSTYDATFEEDEPRPSCGYAYETVWRSLEVTERMPVQLAIEGYQYGVVAVYQGEGSFDTIFEVACNDGRFESQNPMVDFIAEPGVTYFVQIDYRTNNDPFELRVTRGCRDELLARSVSIASEDLGCAVSPIPHPLF